MYQSRQLSYSPTVCLSSFLISLQGSGLFTVVGVIQVPPCQAFYCSPEPQKTQDKNWTFLTPLLVDAHSSMSSSKPFLNLFIFLADIASQAQRVPCVFHRQCEVAKTCPMVILRWPPSASSGVLPIFIVLALSKQSENSDYTFTISKAHSQAELTW